MLVRKVATKLARATSKVAREGKGRAQVGSTAHGTAVTVAGMRLVSTPRRRVVVCPRIRRGNNVVVMVHVILRHV